MLRIAMRLSPSIPSEVRAIAGIVGGLLLICTTAVNYTYMHIDFFGAPHFALDTPKGRAEINYALSTLLVIGMGIFFLCLDVRTRRKNG
jgi:hypothetical protein